MSTESTWFAWLHTAKQRGAGTDANVFMVVYGKKNGKSVKSDVIPLDNKGDNFEAGQVDKFKVEMIDIGKPYKMRIGHDGTKPFAGWMLDKVINVVFMILVFWLIKIKYLCFHKLFFA